MTEAQYKAYFENLAIQSKDINHDPDAKEKAFFVVDNPFDLTEVDNAIRNSLKMPAMLLDVPKFIPSGNGSANYTNTVEGSFIILKKAAPGQLSTVRDECLTIGMRMLYRMHYDYKRQQILAGRNVFFRMDDTDIEPVGPIVLSFHGYMFSFRFVCPFGFTVSGANWSDI